MQVTCFPLMTHELNVMYLSLAYFDDILLIDVLDKINGASIDYATNVDCCVALVPCINRKLIFLHSINLFL